jgi:hypothetical protein
MLGVLGQHAVLSLPQEPEAQEGEGEDEEAAAGAGAGVGVEVVQSVIGRLVDPLLDVCLKVGRDAALALFVVGVDTLILVVVAHVGMVCPRAVEPQGVGPS